jgi:hypothetical protein
MFQAHPVGIECRFRFQCGARNYPIDLSGLNWDRNPGSVPIEAENMVRSGEDTVSFNPTWHVLVQPFAYKKLWGKCFGVPLQVWATSRMSMMHSSKK